MRSPPSLRSAQVAGSSPLTVYKDCHGGDATKPLGNPEKEAMNTMASGNHGQEMMHPARLLFDSSHQAAGAHGNIRAAMIFVRVPTLPPRLPGISFPSRMLPPRVA
ncbi:hypothetical protein DFH09DRAFT_1345021 [Mycena vulgaris]|nr:hypothetical protein DFH09DRAFT_1345021 [Mycena vulgaris]